MQRGRKVLILSADYGAGHRQAARAVQEQIERLVPRHEVLISNVLELAYPRASGWTRRLYLKSFTWYPSLYGWTYYKTQEMENGKWVKQLFNRVGVREMRELLRKTAPDVVLSTFPMLTGMMSRLRRKGESDVPFYTVVTDYGFHSCWIAPCVDGYFVATEDLRGEFVKRGVAPDRVFVTGIPIRPVFADTVSPQLIREKYGLDPGRPVVLLLAGAYGVTKEIADICAELRPIASRVQLIFICGKNGELARRLRRQTAAWEGTVRVLGYSDKIHEWMRIADLVVTKPGGLTVSEAIWAECPMLFYRPVPGQEKENADYLSRKGAALSAETPREAAQTLAALLAEPDLLRAMRKNIKASLKPSEFAADAIVKRLFGMQTAEEVAPFPREHPLEIAVQR
ncbi:diglucosyl diacylglycerol synthase [Bacillaceae bacterium]